MTEVSKDPEKIKGNRNHCDWNDNNGLILETDAYRWVIRKDHYSPLSVGVGVCLCAVAASLSSGSQQQLTKVRPQRHIQMWHMKDKSADQQRVSQPHSFALPSIWQMAWACLRPWQWGVWWLQRPSVICRNITGCKKVTVSQTHCLLKGQARR